MFCFFILSNQLSHQDGAASLGWSIRSVGVLQEGTIRSRISCRTGPLHSAAMKFSLIVAVVVLALAQGSFAQDLPDFERLGQFFDEIKNKMTEMFDSQDLGSHAQNVKTQLEPLAAQMQEQLRSVATNVEGHLQPVAEGVQTHLKPMMDNLQKQMEAFLQTLKERATAIEN